MIVPCGIITTSSPLSQGDQCLGLAPRGYKPHPCRDMDCRKDLYGPQCEHGILCSDPPQVTTGSWEPLKPDSDCPETQLHTPRPTVHSQNSQPQRGKAPTVTGCRRSTVSPASLPHQQREQRHSHSQLSGALPWRLELQSL